MKIGQLCLQVQAMETRLNYWIIRLEILGKEVSMNLGSLLKLSIDKLHKNNNTVQFITKFLDCCLK